MAQQNLNVGTPNGKDGDFVRDAFVKAEANFTELYAGGIHEGYTETGTQAGNNLDITIGSNDAGGNAVALSLDETAAFSGEAFLSVGGTGIHVYGSGQTIIDSPLGVTLLDRITINNGVGAAVIEADNLTTSKEFQFPDTAGTLALTSNIGFSEWSTYTGTRAGGSLIATLGDFDDTGNSVKLIIDDANGTISASGADLYLAAGYGLDIAGAVLYGGSGTIYLDTFGDRLFLGDVSNDQNGTKILLTDTAQTIELQAGNGIILDTTKTTSVVTVDTDSLTTARAVSFPDQSGTIALTSDIIGGGTVAEDSGIAIAGRTGANYGPVGVESVDLTYSITASSTLGVTGNSSFAAGYENTVEANAAGSLGYLNSVRGYGSYAFGSNLTTIEGSGGASGPGYNFSAGTKNTSEGDGVSTIGYGLYGTGNGLVVVGTANLNTINSFVRDQATDEVFVVGNGTTNATHDALVRSNALVILKNGTITAPSLTTALIGTAGNSALTTKEYVDASFSDWVSLTSTFANGDGSLIFGDHGDNGNSTIVGIDDDNQQVLLRAQAGIDIDILGGTFYARLLNTNLTAQRDFEFPNVAGTLATTNDTIDKTGYTVATLPGTPSTGDRTHVTDSNVAAASNFGTTVVTGSTFIVPVFYDGTNWIIG
jgi:hypothetical protein